MRIRVLGSAAGGGYPQWNCNHPNSRRARSDDINAPQRTQSSLCVSADGENWVLLNASPDLRQQINDNEILHPKVGLRHSPIKSIVLTNADVDHVAGLLNLRESQPLNLYGTERVLSVLRDNTIFNVLNPQFVNRKNLTLDENCDLFDFHESGLGLTIIPFSVPGKVALWLEDKKAGDNFGTIDEDTIALEIISRDGSKFFYVPACAEMTPLLADRLENAELVFFDGTLWVDDEMLKEKVGIKTGRRMGHMSVSGRGGTLESFSSLNVKRKVFIHINTTNPILASDSVERKIVTDAGWEVAQDGMDIQLSDVPSI
jgi:pyrroloquinoline quinone biosynthesis protein B